MAGFAVMTAPASGARLGPYTLAAKLGEGGMGVVYSATDPRLKRSVAIKFLAPELTRDETAKQRFLQEAQAVSAIDHANVCTIYDINEVDDGRLYLVMALYEGETLKQRIARGPLPVAEAVDLGRQVGEGLAAAHAAGIVHRDIKPANVIVTTDGSAKILDFGIAKLTGVTGLTETGITLGTVSYMSPEQVNGEHADQQSDVWALGAVFYEMVTGQPPFRGDHPAVVIHAITGSAPTPVRTLCPEATPAVAAVVTNALEKSRARRYATVQDFLAALATADPALSPRAGAGPATAVTTPQTDATVVSSFPSSEVPSIAVLPFADMSAAKDQDYFCEGLAEELIDALARLKGLRVVARTSAFRFKGDAPDLRDLGDKLNVSTVLEGSVRKSGTRLRINAQLINVTDGFHLWTERYDRELDDIFAVQDDIARAVVGELKVKLLGASDQPMVVRPTDSLEAYSCYMQGRHYRFSRYNAPKASQCFEEAVRHDPNYAAAWAGVAQGAVLTGIFMQQRPHEAAATARTAVERALTLDDGLAEAHDAAARVHFYFDWQWAAAEREFTTAIELDPANTDTHASYGGSLGWLGRTEEALSQVAKARELDPLSAHTFAVAGYVLLVGRRYEEAIAACHQALELEPDSALARRFLAFTYQASAQPEKALATLRQVSGDTARSPTHLAILGHALARVGQESEARRISTELNERKTREYVSAWQFAVLHLGLGEFDQALDRLEEAYEERSLGLFVLQTPEWDSLRDHNRLRDVRRRVGLPDPV